MILVLLIVFSLLSCSKNNEARTHIISHRGASGEEIEHTFAAYDLAIAYGSRMIEQDVVLTKDSTLIVSHDLSARRITGKNVLYKDLTDSEVRKLRTRDGQHILSLEEVFNKYRTTDNNLVFVIELKDAAAVAPFIKLVDKYSLQNRIIVQCFGISVLKAIKKHYDSMTIMYLVSTQDKLDSAISEDFIDIISVHSSLMKEDNINKVHRKGKKFNVWTLNTAEEIKKAIKLGVDSYFTNYTAKALLLEKQYRK